VSGARAKTAVFPESRAHPIGTVYCNEHTDGKRTLRRCVFWGHNPPDIRTLNGGTPKPIRKISDFGNFNLFHISFPTENIHGIQRFDYYSNPRKMEETSPSNSMHRDFRPNEKKLRPRAYTFFVIGLYTQLHAP